MRIEQSKAYTYLLSGRCFVTFHNTEPKKKTESQFSYVIKQKYNKETREPISLWYVYYNSGYIGYIRRDVFILETGQKAEILYSKAQEVFAWMWKRILQQMVPDTIHILHNGYCGHCGKMLTDAISIEYGIGPKCRKKLGIY